MAIVTMTEPNSDPDDEVFLRRLIFPEEDRHRFTATPWRGGFRWFRSDNVVCLEHYRRLKVEAVAESQS